MSRRRSIIGLVVLLVVVSAATQWWVSSSQQRLGRQVAQASAPGDIRMISSVTCPICTAARRWFQAHAVPFDECFIEKDAACAARFEALLAPGTPVIVVRGQPQLGFDPKRVLLALKTAR